MKSPNNLSLRARSLVSSALLLFATSTLAMAAPLWKIDLDSMDVDTQIATGSYVPGTTNSLPQTVGSGSVIVRENFTVGNSTLPGRSIVLTQPEKATAANTRFTLLGTSSDYTANTDYELTFDVLITESALANSTSLNVRMINNHSTTSVGAIVFHNDGSLLINSAFAESIRTSGNVWKTGEVTHFKLQIDSDNKRFNVIVNNALVAFLDLDNSQAQNPNLGVGRIWFGSNSDNARFPDGIAIANIETFDRLSPIPEPSRVALLLGGAALLFIFKSRNPRSTAQ